MPTFPDGAPCWSDYGSDDIPALADFLSGVMGWTAETPPAMGGYTILSADAGPVAGIGPRKVGGTQAHASLSLATADVDAVARRAADAGAHLDAGPVTVPGVGRFAVCGLPGDQHVVLWQTLGQDGFAALGRPGTPCWFELVTPEVGATEAILAEVFDVDFSDGPEGARVATVAGAPQYMLFPLRAGLAPGWAVTYEVEDLDATVARCRELGGTVLEGETGTEGGLRFQALTAPDGAPFWVGQRV